MAKERGTSPSSHGRHPRSDLPSDGRPSAPGRAAATSPLQPRARPPRGGGAALRRPLTCCWGCGRRGCGGGPARPPLPASTQATCATSCRRGASTAANSNRRRRRRCCRRRRCAAPARLPLGAR
ncbi:unnamed protein product [Pipistrellus nathusii]|uniref:Uncharacterized protein n=1 Tax=Pipistrellus nathusii TaxID=59473 RepID=A0ABN9ZBA5_PIPNA